MKRLLLILLMMGLLALTVPWFFIGTEPSEVWGLPGWVVYALAMTALFPLAIALLLKFAWHVFDPDPDSNSNPDVPPPP